ncbi:DUF2334 domain-containing protein [uncultured Clostridium sp.]|uniref:DUF2334 domain-containing protein n=1 Tax=uncultured Clostridium sp. TaxID=59620 RepID=UPI00262F5E4C|nr:DUF2334 domain-containing protein [uncultured Clostridium sp.]
MMFKRVLKITIALLALSIIIPSIKSMATTINHKILIIYDSSNVYGEGENILEQVNRVATESNIPVNLEKVNFTEENNIKDLDEYSNIIILNCNTQIFNGDLLKELNAEANKITYISDIQNSGLSYKKIMPIPEKATNYFTFRNELLNNIDGRNVSGDKYLVINNVTPFINLNDLVDKIKYLNGQGIPFIINAIPVFENPTFKAMQNFTEALRYAQASGGYVILSCPYINQGNATAQEIFAAMEEGYKNYVNYLVYPIGISMPNYLLYNQDLKTDLEKSNTVFVENSTVATGGITDYDNPVFKNVIEEISYKDAISNNINSMAGSVGVSIDDSVDLATFKTDIQNLINNGIAFSTPRNLNSEIEINGNKIQCKADGVYLNGKYVQQNTYISNKELFKTDSSNATTTNNNDIDISKISDKLLIFGAVACILFIIITILSKRIDKKKYFR